MSLCLSPTSPSTGSLDESGVLLIGPPKNEVLSHGNAFEGEFASESTSEGAFVVENAPKSQIHAENALEKGSPGALECILGPEPCPKVTPTLSLVPAASSSLGWDSPETPKVSRKKTLRSGSCQPPTG